MDAAPGQCFRAGIEANISAFKRTFGLDGCKPVQAQMVVLGDMSLGGSIIPAKNLAEDLQVAFDAGAKRILIPMSSAKDIATIPAELFAKFQISFYSDPVDAVFKALGILFGERLLVILISTFRTAIQGHQRSCICV